MCLRRFDQLLLLGFTLVIIGMTFIVLGQDTSSGFVFVFPFIFIGDVTPLIIIPLLILCFVVIIFLVRPIFSTIAGDGTIDEAAFSNQYVRISELCMICGGPVPERSEYCPSCGTSMDAGREQ